MNQDLEKQSEAFDRFKQPYYLFYSSLLDEYYSGKLNFEDFFTLPINHFEMGEPTFSTDGKTVIFKKDTVTITIRLERQLYKEEVHFDYESPKYIDGIRMSRTF